MTPGALLTPRQRDALVAIRACVEATGVPPRRRDLQRTLGYAAPSSVQPLLHALERAGLIEVLPREARGIRLTTAGRIA